MQRHSKTKVWVHWLFSDHYGCEKQTTEKKGLKHGSPLSVTEAV